MDYKKAASYWEEKDKQAVSGDRETVLREAEKFLKAHNTCALATADLQGFVRCTPLEYTYMDGKFWIMSEGGLKFKGLEVNKHVALAISDPYEGFGKLAGLQVMGTAELIEPWSEPYLAFLKAKRIPEEALRKLPEAMHLIMVTPVSMDFLCSAFKEKGWNVREHLEF